MRSPGSGRTTASWIAYRMPKGVICAGVSAGSNQLGAIVTCMAYTSSPVGLDCAWRLWLSPTVHARKPTSRAIRYFTGISFGLSLSPTGWTDFLRQAPHGLPDQRQVHGVSVCRQGTPTFSTVARVLPG